MSTEIDKSTEEKHKHKWEVFVSDKLDREPNVCISRSPCSDMDDIIATVVRQLQGCKCGKTSWRIVRYEKERYRGDDVRRAAGLQPWGNLPGSHG